MISFEGQDIVIATKHGKEKVIAPLLKEALGLSPFLVKGLDTDALGTFSGETERKLSPIDTLKKKCELALAQTHCELAIASEGSFGPHPAFFFTPADEELVYLIDRKSGFECFGKALSVKTNFNGKEINSIQAALSFAKEVGFPDHGLIIKESERNFREVFKGITEEDKLIEITAQLLSKHDRIWIETDMRAMMNPSRMKVIEEATINLVKKMTSLCPSCSFPGFWITKRIKGLKCSNCGLKTKAIKSHIYKCQSCAYESEKHYPYGKKWEAPMYCDFCNP